MRFIREYANEKIGRIYSNKELTEEEKVIRIRIIDRAVHSQQLGLITIDETMKEIAEA